MVKPENIVSREITNYGQRRIGVRCERCGMVFYASLVTSRTIPRCGKCRKEELIESQKRREETKLKEAYDKGWRDCLKKYEVKLGKWIPKDAGFGAFCSCCGSSSDYAERYCKSCGAKMESEGKNRC